MPHIRLKQNTTLTKGNLALLGDFFEGWFAKLQPCIFKVTALYL